MDDPTRRVRRVRIGFACVWDAEPRRTWSYTPWDLREALRRRPDVELVDVGIELPLAVRRLLQLAALRRSAGRWVWVFEHLRAWEAASEAYLNRRAAALHCDAVLQIQDLGVMSTPYFIYQDLSYDVTLGLIESRSEGANLYFPHLNRARAQRRRERQLRIYRRAAGVLPMSEFVRRSLIERTGLDPARVHTVHPGAVASAPSSPREALSTPNSRARPRTRLLFVGTTFEVKGGDLVVAAFERLRERIPALSLTVVGPSRWPLPGNPPPGVDYLGRVDPRELPEIYGRHDLLVVPSRFEAFGKVFVEALARGLPCVARDAFAMPELIRDGDNGALVRSESPSELAECIARVLDDDAIYARCLAQRDAVLAHFNWDRAAADVVAAILKTRDA